jgi:hypothetical protein
MDVYIDDICFSDSSGTCLSLPKDYPANLQIDLGMDAATDRSIVGSLYGKYNMPDYAGVLNRIASDCTCPGCNLNGYYCEITNNLYSSTRGMVNLSRLNIRYDTVYRNEFRFLDPTPANDSYTNRDGAVIRIGLAQPADSVTIDINGIEYSMQPENSLTYVYDTADNTTQLPEGAYIYFIKATRGGSDFESKTRVFTVDRAGPQINITSPYAGQEFEYDDITLEYNASAG